MRLLELACGPLWPRDFLAGLKKLGLPNLKSVAAELNIPKSSSMQKEKLMKAIMRIYPLARAEEIDEEEYDDGGLSN